MHTPARITWDDANEADHIAKHGLAFELAVELFLDPDRFEIEARPDRHGEPRCKVVGCIDGLFYATIFAMRGDTAHIVSIRRANIRERPWRSAVKL